LGYTYKKSRIKRLFTDSIYLIKAKYRANVAASKYIIQCTSLPLPESSIKTVYAINPIESPKDMLKERGIMTAVKKAGKAS
jgi:hypothetical protein